MNAPYNEFLKVTISQGPRQWNLQGRTGVRRNPKESVPNTNLTCKLQLPKVLWTQDSKYEQNRKKTVWAATKLCTANKNGTGKHEKLEKYKQEIL